MVLVTPGAPRVLGLDSGAYDRTLCTSHEGREHNENPPLPRLFATAAPAGTTHRFRGNTARRMSREAVGAEGGWPASEGLARKADGTNARHGSRHGASEADGRPPARLPGPGRPSLGPHLIAGEHAREDLPRSRLDHTRRPGGPGGDAAPSRRAFWE